MTSQYFTESHQMFRDSARRFIEEELAPHADEWEKEKLFPRSVFDRMGELGFLGAHYPEEVGGSGGDIWHSTVLAEELREPGFLGVQLREETERAEGGALVTQVVAGSPATQAGLKQGDIVIEFEGTAIRGPLALTQRIHTRQPGETVTLTYLDAAGKPQAVDVTLGKAGQ